MDWLDETLIQSGGEKIFQRIYLKRFIFLLFFVFWLILSVVFLNFFINKNEWINLSQKNQFLEIVSFPPRGLILDRNNKVLAANVPSLDILLDYSLLTDAEKENVKNFIGENNLDFKVLYERYILIKDISDKKILELRSLISKPEDLRLIESHKRSYSLKKALGNVLGYVGFPTEEESSQFFNEEYIGKTGIEKTYQNYLRGVPGVVQFEKNVKGSIRRSVEKSKLTQGYTLIATIDSKFQQKSFEIMDNYFIQEGYKKGALIALNPKNGEILALISYPNYDNNVFLNRSKDVQKILTDSRSPLFNRVISGLYAPGSTIKPIVAAGALEEKIISPEKQIFSSGELKVPNPYFPGRYSVFKDWKAHGWTNVYKAIADSVNVYFYVIGGGFGDQKGLGVYRLKNYYEKFGLGKKTGIDFEGEKEGFIADPETKKKTIDPVWRLGDTFNMSIGQGYVQVTPLQITEWTAAFATNKIYRPYFIKKITAPDGKIVFQNAPKILKENIISGENLKIIQKGMRMTITSGTAKTLNDLPVAIAGKSGTPEILGKRKLNAIFTGYAPFDNPEIVLTVLIEEVPIGSVSTLPLFKQIMRAYFEEKYPKLFPKSTAAPAKKTSKTATTTIQ